MTDIKNGVNSNLKEGVVNNLDLNSKMEHQGVKKSSTGNVWRVLFYLVLIVALDLFVNVILVELLSFFVSYENQV